MLAAIYPFVAAILYVLMPLTEGWPIWERSAILAPVMVFSIVYGIAPIIQQRFA
jgi:antibiotic biosynthesis monooxygenase (ABM) superfamily enzyme